MKKKCLYLVDLDDLRTSKDGRICLEGRYWLVHKRKALFHCGSIVSPQCNSDYRLAKRWCERTNKSNYFGIKTDIVWVEKAYIPLDSEHNYCPEEMNGISLSGVA